MSIFEEDYFENSSNYKLSGGYENNRQAVIDMTKFNIDSFIPKLKTNAKILSLGCAYGYEIEAFQNSGFLKVFGCDISKHAIKKAKTLYPKSKSNFFVDNAQNPKTKEKFDLLYAAHILEHLPQPLEALKAWSKMLNKKGQILILMPHASGIDRRYRLSNSRFLPKFLKNFFSGGLETDPTHISVLPEYKWHQFFKLAGLKPVFSEGYVFVNKFGKYKKSSFIPTLQVFLLEKSSSSS